MVTFKETVFVSVQLALAPVTVYTVVTAGDKVCEPPVSAPGFQVYDVAPTAVSTVEFPEQMLPPVNKSVGVGVTVIVSVAGWLAHPLLAPVTVYAVVDVGLSVCVAPLSDPGLHEYVVAPVALITIEPVEQIDPPDALTVGVVITFTATVAVDEQPSALPVTE